MTSDGGSQRLLSFALWMAILFLSGYLLVIAQSVLIPLVLAIFFWYLINMLSAFAGHLRIAGRTLPATLRLLLSGCVLFVAAYAVVNIITTNVNEVISSAPLYQANLQRILDDAEARFDFVEIPPLARLFGDLELEGLIRGIATGFGTLIGNLGLIAIYLIFMFLEQRYFPSKLAAVLPAAADRQRVQTLLLEIDRDVRRYVGIKIVVSAITAAAAWGIMILTGLDFAGFWALLIFVLNFIPNVGSLVATVMPSLLALVQFDTLTPFLIIAAGVGGIQFMVGNVLEPRLMGKSLNVSPLVIVLSLVFWGFVWGIPGMFLCVPFTVVGMIVLNNFRNTRWLALLLSRDGKMQRT